MTLHRGGLEAAAITTTAFKGLATMTAAALGDPEVRLVTLPHPLGGIDANALEDRAAAALDEVEGWLAGILERRNPAP